MDSFNFFLKYKAQLSPLSLDFVLNCKKFLKLGLGTECKIQTIVKTSRLPYVIHRFDTSSPRPRKSMLLQRRNLDRPTFPSTNTKK
jgi:hypothetical protein